MNTSKQSSSRNNRIGGQNQGTQRGSQKSEGRGSDALSKTPSTSSLVEAAPLTASLGSIAGAIKPMSTGSHTDETNLPTWKETALMFGGVVVVGLLLEGARRLSGKMGGLSHVSDKITDKVKSKTTGKSSGQTNGKSKGSGVAASSGGTSGIFDKAGSGSSKEFGSKRFNSKKLDQTGSGRYSEAKSGKKVAKRHTAHTKKAKSGSMKKSGSAGRSGRSTIV